MASSEGQIHSHWVRWVWFECDYVSRNLFDRSAIKNLEIEQMFDQDIQQFFPNILDLEFWEKF